MIIQRLRFKAYKKEYSGRGFFVIVLVFLVGILKITKKLSTCTLHVKTLPIFKIELAPFKTLSCCCDKRMEKSHGRYSAYLCSKTKSHLRRFWIWIQSVLFAYGHCLLSCHSWSFSPRSHWLVGDLTKSGSSIPVSAVSTHLRPHLQSCETPEGLSLSSTEAGTASFRATKRAGPGS